MKQGIMNAFSDVVLVVTLLSGTEKRVPWATVQVPFLPWLGCKFVSRMIDR